MTVPHDPVRILVPAGMLGAGFPPETVARGLELGADVIAIDGGSTDSGPHYLGSGTPKTTTAAVAQDLRLWLIVYIVFQRRVQAGLTGSLTK